MTSLLSIVWNPSEGLQIGSFTLHYYSLMFVIAFSLGWFIMKPIFRRDGETDEKLDSLFVYMVLSILIGARLGDVIFYHWFDYYPDHLLEIFLPIRENPGETLFGFIKGWEFTGYRGLASHGAAIAVIIAMYFYKTKVLKRSYLWILDRVVIPVASGAIFVRIGNFFNSEIVGDQTTSPLGVQFIQDTISPNQAVKLTGLADSKLAFNAIASDPKFAYILEQVPAKHPSQLYEAFGYIFVFAALFIMYWKTEARNKSGLLFGLFLVMLFTVRIIVEFVKESQGGFEGENPILSTGQWLSIPFIFIGLFFIFRAEKLYKEKQVA